MKKYINISAVMLMFFSISCGIFSNMTKDQSFVKPVQKNHPRLLYPKTAQENNITGNSKILIYVTSEGAVDKVEIIKSSGNEILDNAAIDYGKSLLFQPALRNNKPVYSRMEMDIKFNIAKPDYDPNLYIQSIKNLYRQFELAGNSERISIQRRILDKHEEFIENNNDALNFNLYTEKILLPEITKEWSKVWDGYPLTFLLYHDFISRFPDFDSLDNVKKQLQNTASEDIEFINNYASTDRRTEIEKENLLLRIENFVKNKYPDVLIKNLNSNKQVTITL